MNFNRNNQKKCSILASLVEVALNGEKQNHTDYGKRIRINQSPGNGCNQHSYCMGYVGDVCQASALIIGTYIFLVMKTSFILHLDSLQVFKKLNNEQSGQLIKCIIYYQENGKLPDDIELWLDLVMTNFVNQFNRDNEKYLSICERNAINGKAGGRPKKETNKPKETQKTQSVFEKPKKADNDNDSDSDNDSDNDSEKEKDSDNNKRESEAEKNELPEFVKEIETEICPDLIEELKKHHKHKVPIRLLEDIAKQKNGYITLVQAVPLWKQKRKYLKATDREVFQHLVEWLRFNVANKISVDWENYAEMAQHAFNFIDKKLKQKQ
jgi:hypothetical protein